MEKKQMYETPSMEVMVVVMEGCIAASVKANVNALGEEEDW